MEILVPISLITALLMFLLNLWFERSAVRATILTDMKNLLRRARETLEYLDSDSHYWLEVGRTLTRAPTDIPIQINSYQSLLPKLYLLGPGVLARILAFYSHYQYCDGLKGALFNHIKNHVESERPMSEADVQLLNLRRNRICMGMKSLLNAEDFVLRSRPGRLPDAYSIPSTKEVAALVNSTLATDSKRLLLP